MTAFEAFVLAFGLPALLVLARAAHRERISPLLVVLGAAALILVLTLTPRDGVPLGPPRLSLVGGRRGGGDLIANVALFVPLGMALAGAKLRLWQTLVGASLLSLAIETAQYWIPGRTPAVGDVVMNALGGLSGWLLVRGGARFRARGRAPVALALLFWAFPPAVVAATGWLLTPLVRDGEYLVRWTPARRDTDRFAGAITAVRIGDKAFRSGRRAGPAPRLHGRILDGEPLVIEGIAGEPTPRPSLLVRNVVRWGQPRRAREMLAVLAHGDELIVRVARRAERFRLFETYHRLPGAFSGIAPGEPFRVELRREGRRWCARVQNTGSCGLAFGVADGWTLLVASLTLPSHARTALSYAWVLLLIVPAGLAAPRRPAIAILHAVVVGLAIGVAVWASGTLVVTASDAALLAAGYLLGFAVTPVLRGPVSRQVGDARVGEPSAGAPSPTTG